MKARASHLMIGSSALAAIAVALVGFLGLQKLHSTRQRAVSSRAAA